MCLHWLNDCIITENHCKIDTETIVVFPSNQLQVLSRVKWVKCFQGFKVCAAGKLLIEFKNFNIPWWKESSRNWVNINVYIFNIVKLLDVIPKGQISILWHIGRHKRNSYFRSVVVHWSFYLSWNQQLLTSLLKIFSSHLKWHFFTPSQCWTCSFVRSDLLTQRYRSVSSYLK